MSDNAYRMFRRVADLINIIPCLESLKDIKKELNNVLVQKLGIDTQIQYCTVTLDLHKCVEFIINLHNVTFPGTPVPRNVIIKFSVDGRPNQGVNEVCIGIVPINLGFAPQSCYSTFPLAVMECNERQAVDTTRKYAKELAALSVVEEVPIAGQNLKIVAVMCSDLVSFWSATGLNYTPVKTPADQEFCPCCKKKSVEINNLVDPAEVRLTLPEVGLPASSYIYCSLHAGMRVSGTILEQLLTKLTQADIDRLRDDMRQFGIYIKPDNEITMYGNTVKKLLLEQPEDELAAQFDMNEPKEVIEAREINKLTMQLGSAECSTKLMTTVAKEFKASTEHIKLLNCWSVVYRLISRPFMLSSPQVQLLQKAIDKMSEDWKKLFVDRVTPYVHIVLLHTMQIVSRHGSIGLYSQQGFELSNRLHRAIENRASNHRGGRGNVTVTEQLINNFYGRLELARELALTCFLKMMFGRKVNEDINEHGIMHLIREETEKASKERNVNFTSINIGQNIPSLVPGWTTLPEEDRMDLEFNSERDREDYLNTFVRI